ncbi:MAG: VWA domain-containing protein [Planctomycetota bacterium]
MIGENPDSVRAWRLALLLSALDGSGEGLLHIAEAGRRELTGLLDGPTSARVRRWALADVVAAVGVEDDDSGRRSWVPSVKERRVCLELLGQRKVRGLRTALLTVARRAEDPLRYESFSALARWSDRYGPDEAIDLFLVQQLGARFDVRERPHPVNVVLERLDSSEEPLAPRALVLLRERLEQMLLSTDWREPALALRLARGIPLEERIPILLDALSVWDRRSRAGREYSGLVRVRADLVRELRDISGRFHGPRPAPWIDWWVRVRQGKEPMPGTPEFERARRERSAEPRSTASFFGIRPESDRITFVIDFSGSMAQGWGTTDHSRFEEAVDQMMRFLQGAPPSTRFNVMLFSSSPLLSSPELVPATTSNLELARASLLEREPSGGTNLKPAIELALKLDRRGEPDLDALEADTIIVLCDGETSEGARWVRPLLRRVLPMHPVVFHTVHLGVRDDGALEALAEASGGSFLRVGG